MRRVCTGSQLGSLPAANAAIGTPGYFNTAAPGAGVVPTVPGPDWFQSVQEELAGLVTTSGLALDTTGTSNAQVLQALRRLCGGNYSYISASAVLTPDNAGDIVVNAAAGNVTLTLCAASAAGGRPVPFRIMRNDNTTNVVAIVAAGADEILAPRGLVTQVLAPNLGGWNFYSDGDASWLASLRGPAPRGCAFFDAAGPATWTCPAGVYFVEAEVWDAGAGGGGAPSGGFGGGGGAGAYFRGVVPVTPGNDYGITVGVGGVAGVSSGANGASPAYTSALTFDAGYVQFTGATGGQSVSSASDGLKGTGGSVSTVVGLAAWLSLPGGNGNAGTNMNVGGNGGASFGGAAAGYGYGTGLQSVFPGAGGGGGDGGDGAPGANGAIFLRW